MRASVAMWNPRKCRWAWRMRIGHSAQPGSGLSGRRLRCDPLRGLRRLFPSLAGGPRGRKRPYAPCFARAPARFPLGVKRKGVPGFPLWPSLRGLGEGRRLVALRAGVLTGSLSAWQVRRLLVGASPVAVVGKPRQGALGPSCGRGGGRSPHSRSALLLKWVMEKFLSPAVAGSTPEKAPGPRAPEAAAASAQQGSPREAAKHEVPPLPGVPWKKIRAEGLSCDYATLYGRAQADELLQQLEEEVEYFEGELTKLHVFGKWHNIPRKQVTYGDAGLTYTYSGVTFSPKPWTPVLNRIRDRVQLVTGHTFNFVLINRYKDGHDHIGEHRDDERELVPRSPIASVSFGACRDFIFRHGASRGKNPSRRIAPVKLHLDHGSLLMMNFPTNHYWYHSLPSRKKVLAPRINLTFRKVRTL